MKPMTPRKRERQDYRSTDGRYATVNPCQICGRSAGIDYCSDRRTDCVDSAGNSWGDKALCLCGRCATKLEKLADAAAYAIVSGTAPAPWLT